MLDTFRSQALATDAVQSLQGKMGRFLVHIQDTHHSHSAPALLLVETNGREIVRLSPMNIDAQLLITRIDNGPGDINGQWDKEQQEQRRSDQGNAQGTSQPQPYATGRIHS